MCPRRSQGPAHSGYTLGEREGRPTSGSCTKLDEPSGVRIWPATRGPLRTLSRSAKWQLECGLRLTLRPILD